MKFNKYFLLVTLLCIPTTIHPMAAAKRAAQAVKQALKSRLHEGTKNFNFEGYNNWAQRSFQTPRHAFNTVCKGIGLCLTFGPMWYESLKGATVIKTESMETTHRLPEASPEATEFFHEQCKIAGIKNPSSISIKNASMIVPTKNAAALYNTHIFIGDDPNTQDSITDVLKTKRNLSPQSSQNPQRTQALDHTINIYQAIGQHEATHIKNNDMFRSTVITPFLIPFGTHWACKSIKILRQFNTQHNIIKAPTLWAGVKCLLGGVCKYGINTELNNAYARHQEYRADKGISDNINTLQAYVDHLKEAEAQVDQGISLALFLQGRNPTPLNIYLMKHYLHSRTPFPSRRASRLEQRIAALKNKEAQKQPFPNNASN